MKIGIITYHSAYNFGSVLQAYATERVLESYGHSISIINYRIPFQKQYYGIWGYGEGIKAPIKKIMMLPQIKKRRIRQNRFEEFISLMNLTNEINAPEELSQFSETFDLYISGSDQTWNIHSNEYLCSGYNCMYPYLLTFTDKKKISYASSIVNMSDEELAFLKKYMMRFDRISCREYISANRISKLLGKTIERVADPILLIDGDGWRKISSGVNLKEDRYILYYSLKNYNDTRSELNALNLFAEQLDLRVIAFTPLIPLTHYKNVINIPEAGPKEFISYIDNALLVITDSYHGMLFAVNFKKNFYYLKNNKGDKGLRASDILEELELSDRIISNMNQVNVADDIDYSIAMERLALLKESSMNYIEDVLKWANN